MSAQPAAAKAAAKIKISTKMTLWEAFATAMAASPQRTAIVAADGRVTAATLAATATALSVRLMDAGARPGRAVLLLLPNSVRYAAALFAIARTGATAIPLDPGLTERELGQIVDATGAQLAVVGAVATDAAVREAFARTGTDGSTLRLDTGDVPSLERSDTTRAGVADAVAAGETSHPLGEMSHPLGRPAVTDTAVLFFTSGTTGAPKGVAHSHRGMIASFLSLERMHREFFAGPISQRVKRVVTVTKRYGGRVIRAAGRQVWMTPIPFHAIGGHEVLVGALLGGHTLVTTPAFHPRRTMELLVREKVNVFPATPAMVETILRLRDFAGFDLSSLLVVGLGGAPAGPELVRRAQAAFGCSVTVGYGSTELGGGVLVTRIDDSDDVKRETVGRPFPGADVRIVDDAGDDVPAGTPGELVCRVGSVMAGYHEASPSGGDDDAPPVDADGWYHTNDLAVRDAAGNIRIVGRKDDLIIRGGNKIRPTEVEAVLEGMAGVRQAAVVGVPAPKVGQQVWAFVVPDTPAPPEPLERAALLAHCRANLAPQKVPDHIRLCASLPTTSLGKVQRYRLAELAREDPEMVSVTDRQEN